MLETIDDSDRRAAIATDLKQGKRGLGLAAIRKRGLAAQGLPPLPGQLAPTPSIPARSWLAPAVSPPEALGVVRLPREVWAVPGRVMLVGDQGQRVRRICSELGG
jgi:hypothetical protein